MLLRFLIFLIVTLGLTPHAFADGINLHRGLNLSNWLANAERQQMTERDFAQIKQAGFDHIRLPVNPELLGFHFDQKVGVLNFGALDAAIALAAKYNLAVILDVHLSLAKRDELEEDSQDEAGFISMWNLLAQHYNEQNYPPSQLAFELLNEPHYYHREEHYHDLMQIIVEYIRASSPQRTLIIGAPQGSSIAGLTNMFPLNDEHITYDFHFYEPYMITHQGIHRGFEKSMLHYFHDVPYPSNLVIHDASFYAEQAPDQGQAEKELQDYVRDDWNAAHIKKRIDAAHAWAVENHVPIICSEFGILRTHIDPQSRYRWISDTRQALESDNISWDLWDYADLMGIVTLKGDISAPDPVDGSVHLIDPAKGSRPFEPEALQALGFTGKF